MAFADPQSVTIAGTATSLPRVSSGTGSGSFSTPDQATKLTVSHTYGKRTRHLIRLDNTKTAADPLMAGVNVQASMSAYLVVDVPKSGYTLQQQADIVNALTAYLTASTNAKTTQLLGGEN